MKKYKYDVIVVGGGHAGIEAALCSARRGASTLFLTMDTEKIGQMSCNPAVGGLGKSHLVRDLDALGGEMAKAVDYSGIQFRMLNRTKGPAVWSLRVQADPALYKAYFQNILYNTENLTIKQAEAEGLLVENNTVKGIKTVFSEEIACGAVILCNGTFLNGKIFIGYSQYKAGRAWEFPSDLLAENLRSLGIITGRLKTGTPARLWGPSMDFSRFEIQKGDRDIEFFSLETIPQKVDQINCYIGYTNPKVHEIIRNSLHKSPMYGRKIIEGTGPRYCPSIEDKVIRFSDKARHQIFFEPVTRDFSEVYPSGISTSLPLDVQLKFYRAVEGLEEVEFIKPAYAIEYDFADPVSLKATLQHKSYSSLFLAGQINGTSGYEEAAVQGFMAGCNAVNFLSADSPVVLDRDESYIGVLINDLVARGVDEPYRMFTSRAEHRLFLRLDNSEERLLKYGRKLGLIKESRWERYLKEQEQKNLIIDALKKTNLREHDGLSLYRILKRPEKKIEDFALQIHGFSRYPLPLLKRIETEIKYEGYISRQTIKIEASKQYRDVLIPGDIDYNMVFALTREAREKLEAVKPQNLYEASMIPGITPANTDAVHIFIKKNKGTKR